MQVVQACLTSGAHHIDISGEPQFLEKMQLKYHSEAESKGVYVVGACGFDSIPSDVGRQLVHQKMGGPVNSIDMFLEAGADGPVKGRAYNISLSVGFIFERFSRGATVPRLGGLAHI